MSSTTGRQALPGLPPFDMDKIVHFVWCSDLPVAVRVVMARFADMNPGWQIVVHDHVPQREPYRTAFDHSECIGAQSDMIRLDALDRMGGVYVDVDVWPIRPLDEMASLQGMNGHLLLAPSGNGSLWFCAAEADAAAFGAVRAELSANPAVRTQPLLDRLRKFHKGSTILASREDVSPTGVDGTDRDVFRKCLAAGANIDTGRAVIVHGWAMQSKQRRSQQWH